jgi:hypothetical protein
LIEKCFVSNENLLYIYVWICVAGIFASTNYRGQKLFMILIDKLTEKD